MARISGNIIDTTDYGKVKITRKGTEESERAEWE